ncbi:MAG TPA: pseudouridine synthase [Saprospiraceae bacterium]|nr:pseudouridine synthase [Saprospiraceae bacterium]HMP23313.1 pseudouridine synthase [Saprospiraceae bacterium]
MSHRYFILYKPYGYLSQFTKEVADHLTLADLGKFPKDAYPVGRLDKDSEGLLIVTNDTTLNHTLLNPKFQHHRTYLAQVEGIPDKAALQQLRKGMNIKVDGKIYHTLPAEVRLLPTPPELPERNPPIRFRKEIPDSWLEITLYEGKNRQVRKMCAGVGFPVLRLVRIKIEKLELRDLKSGQILELPRMQVYKLLGMS